MSRTTTRLVAGSEGISHAPSAVPEPVGLARFEKGSWPARYRRRDGPLALDPPNEQLLELRSEIASNSASSGGVYGPWIGRRFSGDRQVRQ